MTWNIYRHTEALAEVSFNIDPETSGFCVVRSGSADTKEQKVRRTTTKCSEQRLFVKQNSRQFRVTSIVNFSSKKQVYYNLLLIFYSLAELFIIRSLVSYFEFSKSVEPFSNYCTTTGFCSVVASSVFTDCVAAFSTTVFSAAAFSAFSAFFAAFLALFSSAVNLSSISLF